jgi:hypothetical protein
MMAKKFRLTAPKPYIPKEYDEQVTVFAWAKYCKLDGVDLMYATLNGVRLPIGLARKMKKAGLCAGPPDINVDVARGGFHGLRVEMKREKGGEVSDTQKEWHARLRSEGYRVVVAEGANEAIQAIKTYLDQD